MFDLRHHLIDARRMLYRPFRRWQLRRLGAVGKAPIMVPFYHRVADDRPNPWTLSRQEFLRHVRFAETHFELIGLDEVQRRIRNQASFHPAVSFTFDDGYADNSAFALPLLMRRGIPCTYFVSLDNVLKGVPFPHDETRGQPLAPNTIGQLRKAAAGGIEIGLHTRTHIDCSRISDPKILEDEIITATEELARLLDRPIRYFAFPYGLSQQLTPIAVRMIQRAGLQGFCSAYGGYNVTGRDAFHIRRFHGDEDFARFRNWLEFDARKLRKEPSVEPLPSEADSKQTETLPPFISTGGTSVWETTVAEEPCG